MTDLSMFETTCPERCPQFRKKERENCTGCPGHGQCPLQDKALATMNASKTKFCSAYRGCHERCQACEHFPANFLKTASPELKAEWEAHKRDNRPSFNDVCLLDA